MFNISLESDNKIIKWFTVNYFNDNHLQCHGPAIGICPSNCNVLKILKSEASSVSAGKADHQVRSNCSFVCPPATLEELQASGVQSNGVIVQVTHTTVGESV